MAFWDLSNDPTAGDFSTDICRDLGLEVLTNHLAFSAVDLDDLAVRKQRWLDQGLTVLEIDHGWIASIYTEDPDGIAVEFATLTRPFTRADDGPRPWNCSTPRTPRPARRGHPVPCPGAGLMPRLGEVGRDDAHELAQVLSDAVRRTGSGLVEPLAVLADGGAPSCPTAAISVVGGPSPIYRDPAGPQRTLASRFGTRRRGGRLRPARIRLVGRQSRRCRGRVRRPMEADGTGCGLRGGEPTAGRGVDEPPASCPTCTPRSPGAAEFDDVDDRHGDPRGRIDVACVRRLG